MQFNIPAEHKNALGVYIIRNSVNAKVYVGSTSNFWTRYQAHKTALKKKNHFNSLLQRHSNKYGVECLEFCLLEITEKPALLSSEQKWIDNFKCYASENGFNILPVAGSRLGCLASEGTKAKMSVVRKGKPGKPLSEETKARISSANKGRVGKPLSEEVRSKLSAAHKGRSKPPLSEEHRHLISMRAKAQRLSPEHKAALLSSRKGKPLSEETKAKMSAARKGKPGTPHTPESKEKIAASKRGKPRSPETKAKLSASRKGIPFSTRSAQISIQF